MSETRKITPQKAAALLKKEGKKTKDVTDGSEVVTGEGVVLKEGGTYYLTTEPKPFNARLPDDPIAIDFTGPSTEGDAAEAVIKQARKNKPSGFKAAEPVKVSRATISPAAIGYQPRKQDLGHEGRLFHSGTRRRKSRLLKRVLRAKNQGKALTAYQIDILAVHADGCRNAARNNRGF